MSEGDRGEKNDGIHIFRFCITKYPNNSSLFYRVWIFFCIFCTLFEFVFVIKYLEANEKDHIPFCAAQIWKMTKTWQVNEWNKEVDRKRQEIQYFQDKDIIPTVASCWYLTLYPEANYALYHILGALEAAGCTLPSLNTDFRTGQCRYFFQVGMNLSIELRLGMAHTLVESSNTQKSLCSCISKVLPLDTIIYLNM